jgi:carboxylate-amine ligase
MRTFGVEEELLIVDPADGSPLALAADVLDVAANVGGSSEERGTEALTLKSEFKQEQVEVNSRPCGTAAELRAEIRHGLRRWPRPRYSMRRQPPAISVTPPWATSLD